MKKENNIKRSDAGVELLLAAKRQEQLSEISSTGGMAASASIRANQLKKEAEKILSLDGLLELGTGNEALPPEVEDAREDEFYYIRETLKSRPDFINLDASTRRMELLFNLDCLDMGVDTAQSINAKNSLEKMLAHQATVCHYLSMIFLNRAINPRYNDFQSLSAKMHVEIQTKLINTSIRLMKTFYLSLQTLQKIRSGGKQNITVHYRESVSEVINFVLGKDPVISALLELMDKRETWKASPTELLKTLKLFVPEKIQKSRQWPKCAHVLSRKLNRAASLLKEVGVEVITGIKEGKGERKIVIRKITKNSASCATNNKNKDNILNRL